MPPASLAAHLNRISRQSFVFLIGTLFTSAIGYLFKVYLARTLGAESLGVCALGMTVGGLASIVGAAGLPQTANRFVAVYASTDQNRKLGRFLWTGLAILAVTNFCVGACEWLVCPKPPAGSWRCMRVLAKTARLAVFFWHGLAILAVTNFCVGVAMVVGKRWIAFQLYHTPVMTRYMHFFAAIMVLGALTTFLGQSLAGYNDVARRTVITNFIGTP
jgi:polysaccharide biosynthesis protein